MILSALFFLTSIVTPLHSSENAPVAIETYEQKIEIKVLQCRSQIQENSLNHPDVLKMFDETVIQWKEYADSHPEFDFDLLLKGVTYAAIQHKDQLRKGSSKTPYIIHPIGVARIAWEYGDIRSTDILISALLHDTIEDTKATEEEIEVIFGPRILSIVLELTKDPNLTSEETKIKIVEHAPHISLDAKIVKLSDILYNIHDLKKDTPPDWTPERVHKYILWGNDLYRALEGTNKNLEALLQKEIEDHLVEHST